jgi:pimeloyl-ACP methyl ester carboxylesterase
VQHSAPPSYIPVTRMPTPKLRGKADIDWMTSSQFLPFPNHTPSLALLLAEPFRAMFDSIASHASVHPARVGDGHPVLVYPGLGAGSMTTSHLRSFLSHAGFAARDWGAGVNIGHEGDFDDWLDGLVSSVRDLQAQQGGRKVSLVGWSLGGIFAREIAKRAPQAVRTVITLGTPFGSLGGANRAGTLYQLLNGDVSQITPALEARLRKSPPVPTTSIYSKSDGIVSWRGCIEKRSTTTESIEVDASHLGMVNHPAVLRIVADRLAQPEGGWRQWSAAPLHQA